MITQFKIYKEDLYFPPQPKVTDYVLVDDITPANLNNVLKQIIGQIISINYKPKTIDDIGKSTISYLISFDPKDFLFQNDIKIDHEKSWQMIVNKNNIKHFAKTKEELLPFLAGNKFGI